MTASIQIWEIIHCQWTHEHVIGLCIDDIVCKRISSLRLASLPNYILRCYTLTNYHIIMTCSCVWPSLWKWSVCLEWYVQLLRGLHWWHMWWAYCERMCRESLWEWRNMHPYSYNICLLMSWSLLWIAVPKYVTLKTKIVMWALFYGMEAVLKFQKGNPELHTTGNKRKLSHSDMHNILIVHTFYAHSLCW